MNNIFVDRESVIPLYYQIQQNFLDRIHTGKLKTGDPIPSEQEVADSLQVSRMTARQALKGLCDLGVAYRIRGKGTYVSNIKEEKDFRKLESFTEEMCSRGHRPTTKPLEMKQIPPPTDVAHSLGLYGGEPVIFLRRLRLADSLPLGIERAYLLPKLCPEFIEKFDPRTSLYEFLWKQYGLRASFADETIEAGVSDIEESRLLSIATKSAVFLFTRVTFVSQHRAIEYVKSTYRADHYKIVNRLRRMDARFFRKA